jgi:hypothetical protein
MGKIYSTKKTKVRLKKGYFREYDVFLQNVKFYQSEDGANWIGFFGKKLTNKQITRAATDLIIQNKYAQAFSQLDDSQVNAVQKGFIKIIFFMQDFIRMQLIESRKS